MLDTRTASNPSLVLEGDLSHLPLPELLQFFHLQGRDGMLVVMDEDKKNVAAVCYEGRDVVHAICRGIEGSEAVYAALAQTRGAFRFTAGLGDPVARTVKESVQNLILEGLRRLEQVGHVTVLLPPDDQALYLAPEPPSDDIRLTAREWSILSLVNGKRSIAQVVAASRRDDAEVRAVLAGLLSADLVVEQKDDAYLDMIVPENVAEESASGHVRYAAPTLVGTVVLKKIDGVRTLRQLMAETELDEASVADAIRALAKLGRIGFVYGEREFERWILPG